MKVIVALIISVVVNLVLAVFLSAYKSDFNRAKTTNQDFFELGEAIMEYNRCAHDLKINYRKGTEEYYNSDAFATAASAKSKMKNIKTDILNKYGYQF